MGNAEDHRSLDEIITDNAHLLIKRRIVARRIERRPYYLNTLAEEMAPFMVRLAPGEERSSATFRLAVDRISHTVGRYLGIAKSAKLAWRLDYLEGFFQAMGVSIESMIDRSSMPDEGERAMLEQMLGDANWQIPPPKRSERKNDATSA